MTGASINQAHAHALQRGFFSVQAAREYYDGACIDFAGDFVDSITNGRLLYFEVDNPAFAWRYHAVVEIEGIIHDLWQTDPMPRAEYLELLGAVNPCYPCEEEEKGLHLHGN